jgi:hypothetical protein
MSLMTFFEGLPTIGITAGIPLLLLAFQATIANIHRNKLREELTRIRCILEEHGWNK